MDPRQLTKTERGRGKPGYLVFTRRFERNPESETQASSANGARNALGGPPPLNTKPRPAERRTRAHDQRRGHGVTAAVKDLPSPQPTTAARDIIAQAFCGAPASALAGLPQGKGSKCIAQRVRKVASKKLFVAANGGVAPDARPLDTFAIPQSAPKYDGAPIRAAR